MESDEPDLAKGELAPVQDFLIKDLTDLEKKDVQFCKKITVRHMTDITQSVVDETVLVLSGKVHSQPFPDELVGVTEPPTPSPTVETGCCVVRRQRENACGL